MTSSLAVIAYQVGALSETFIRRHMQDLYPGQTVVVARHADKPYGGHWTVPCPILLTDKQKRGRGYRLQQSARRRLGLPIADETAPVNAFFKTHNVGVVLGEFLDLSFPYLKLAHRLGIPFYGHAHGIDVSARLRDAAWREKYRQYNDSAGVITMSEVSRQRLVDLGIEKSKVHVVPYGIDVPGHPLVRPEQKTVRCVAIGRMVSKKAPILTLDAFRRAALACPHLHLDYIGGGELLPAARQFVQAFGLEDRVTLHGPQSSDFVQAHMREADIFVQHSVVDPDTGDEEGLPVALLEAMGLALPVVATRHAGIPEAVLEGQTGFLVDEGDSAAMGDHIIALAADPDLRSRMGQASWARAKERFTWERERADLLRVMGLSLAEKEAAASKA